MHMMIVVLLSDFWTVNANRHLRNEKSGNSTYIHTYVYIYISMSARIGIGVRGPSSGS